MKRRVALASASILIGGFAWAQPAKDVTGWRTLKWGMSERQVLAALPHEAARLPKPEKMGGADATIKIPHYKFGNVEFEVLLAFTGGQLTNVLLWEEAAPSRKPSVAADFEALAQLLIEKYGKPTTDKNDARTRDRTWEFPSGMASLTFMKLTETDFVSVSYKKTTK